jgi:hypothetical protein
MPVRNATGLLVSGMRMAGSELLIQILDNSGQMRYIDLLFSKKGV